MEDKNIDNELFNPEEMQSPFDSIKEVDAEGHEWWNSRKLARMLGYMKYWNFERLMDKVATFLQQEKGLDLKEHMVEIEEMAQLNNGGYRQVTSFLLSRTACVAIAMNADKKKPITKVAQDYFTQKMDSKELATSFEGNVLIYRTSTGKVNVSVLFNNDTFWLSQKRMSELYNVTIQDISYHLIQINDSGELQLSTAIKKVLIPSDNCDDTGTILYNLDAIIAVGYRVNSYEATQFRIWAREVLKEYIQKGFVLDDERLKGKNPFGADYFEDLLDRIREIRTSERRYYQKITQTGKLCWSDIYRYPIETFCQILVLLATRKPKPKRWENTKSSGEYRIRRFSLTLTGLLKGWIRHKTDRRNMSLPKFIITMDGHLLLAAE